MSKLRLSVVIKAIQWYYEQSTDYSMMAIEDKPAAQFYSTRMLNAVGTPTFSGDGSEKFRKEKSIRMQMHFFAGRRGATPEEAFLDGPRQVGTLFSHDGQLNVSVHSGIHDLPWIELITGFARSSTALEFTADLFPMDDDLWHIHRFAFSTPRLP
jgi:hypothetical protein